MSHGKQLVNIPERENKQNRHFPLSCDYIQPQTGWEQSKAEKDVSALFQILQINRICIFSALVQSDPSLRGGRAIIGREGSLLTPQRQLFWAAWEGSSPFLVTCDINIKLWIAESSWGKFLPLWRICRIPFPEEMRIHLSDLCISQEQKTTKFS